MYKESELKSAIKLLNKAAEKVDSLCKGYENEIAEDAEKHSIRHTVISGKVPQLKVLSGSIRAIVNYNPCLRDFF
ncbi:MAG: hypothetical protein V3U84_07040 [Thiotrichaceae bacterium]